MPSTSKLTLVSKSGKKRGDIEIDDDGKLFWDGKPVVTESKVHLDKWVNIAVIIGGFSTLVIAIYTIIAFYYS